MEHDTHISLLCLWNVTFTSKYTNKIKVEMLKECHTNEGVQVRAFDANDKHKNDGWFPASNTPSLLSSPPLCYHLKRLLVTIRVKKR